jgi:hypothetical protein
MAQGDLDLILAGPPLGFVRWTSHDEFTWRAPTK